MLVADHLNPVPSVGELMQPRSLCKCLVIGLILVATSTGHAKDPKHLTIRNTLKVGGEGGWDYATLNDNATLLYMPRSTHTIVVETATGKTVADFGKLKRGHGVALVPELNRGFVTDG